MNTSVSLTDQELKFLDFSGKHPQKIYPIISEASDRKYFRVVYPDRTLILCKDVRFQYDFVEIADFLGQEQFIVPEILKKDLIHFLILMTDGGEKDLTSVTDDLEYREWLVKSIEILVRLQKTNPIPPVSSREFDLEKFEFESTFTYSNYLKLQKEFRLRTQFRSEVKIFIEECSYFLAEYPVKVFCHRDFHGRNLLINSENQICMIDFQDARMGTPFYDLSSILYDAYRPISFGMRQGLYQLFLKLSEQDFPRFKECYYIQCLQRSYKALGSYFYLVADKKMDKYRMSVLNALDNLLEVVQAGLFPDQLYVFFYLLKEELLSNSLFMKGINDEGPILKFFIPAAGFGTRMKELTKDIPKPLLPVNGIPLIYYSLFQVWKQNAEGAVINTHYMGEKIRKELETFSLFPLVFSEEKKGILGTAGGIRTGLEKAGWMGETIGIVNPDFLYFPENLFQIPNSLSENDCLLYLLPRPESANYTGLELNDGKIIFGKGSLFYIGISVLNSGVLSGIQPETFFDLSYIFKELAAKQRLAGRLFPGETLDLGEKEYYLSLKGKDFSGRFGSRWEEFLELCRVPTQR